MIRYLWALLGWRRIIGADVTYAACGDTGSVLVRSGRGRRSLAVELPREEWVKLAEAIVDGERSTLNPGTTGRYAVDTPQA